MKVFFRKHGNAAFYILLPVFFLILTVAFIQFTPRVSQTAPGDTCSNEDECCTESGCGAEASEVCDGYLCKPVNFGCPEEGVEPDFLPDGTCICGNLDDNGDVQQGGTTPCIQCPAGESFVGGACFRICLEDESPDGNNCVKLEGSGIHMGGCSLGGDVASASSMALFGFGAANLAFLSIRARRKKK
ncbi:MAG: hypothetical protein K8R69_05030 [Deltaproteobacteria bacterium]|nr:hypothetical protein [Deltaproteobacteria bacterium]